MCVCVCVCGLGVCESVGGPADSLRHISEFRILYEALHRV